MDSTRSLGYATDLMIASFDGELLRGEDFVAARTPTSPKFWWGNFVLFANPPGAGDLDRWETTFDGEVGVVPGVEHRTLAWDAIDGRQGEIAQFLSSGYEFTRSVFLVTGETRPSRRHRRDVQVRPLEKDAEWDRALEIAHDSLEPPQNTASFREFQAQQHRRHRVLVGRGLGKWFGAFKDGAMLATMGLYVRDGLARCQSVATAPSYRRQGLCSTLVHSVCAHGVVQMGAERIVIMTEPSGQAVRVYESVGFRVTERVCSLSLAGSAQAGGELPNK
jgi:ribosomal protein S18 acetylase RimI-like enzyme